MYNIYMFIYFKKGCCCMENSEQSACIKRIDLHLKSIKIIDYNL